MPISAASFNRWVGLPMHLAFDKALAVKPQSEEIATVALDGTE